MKVERNKIFLFIFLGVIVSAMALFCFEKYPENNIAFGVKLADIKIGGKSKPEGEKILKKQIENFEKNGILFILENKNKKYGSAIKINELKAEYNLNSSIEQAYSIGKNKGFLRNIKEKLGALLGRQNIPLDVKISEEELDILLTKSFGKFENPSKNSNVVFEEKTATFKLTESKTGSIFSREKIKNEIEKNSQKLKIKEFCLLTDKKDKNCLSLEKDIPKIQKEEAQKAKEQAEDILKAGPYLIFASDKSFLISNSMIGKWFTFALKEENENSFLEVGLDSLLIKNYLVGISKEVNVSPQNPVLSFESGIKIISPPKSGEEIKIDESVKKIQEGILAKKNKIILSLEKKDPAITEQKINELQIEKLIGTGTSNFSGSPKNRINNIKVGAAKFNGILIAPGEIFSFNTTLGPVGAAQGYLPELVIKNNKTIPEYGGGMCQVSTTMFRVAVNSGMEITERHAHAYPVKYYNPQGFDATVYLPRPDLVFKNNTPGYILIQSKIQGNVLSFEFYGKDDGRQVTVNGPYQYDFGSDGSMKARLEEIVKIGDNIIFQKTFLSSYKSPSLFPVERRTPE